MADKVIFTKEWYNEIIKEDDFIKTTPQEVAYILYAAAIYSFTGNKTNIGEVFGENYAGLNRTMSGYYGQIDRIIAKGQDQATKNQKYDNEAIKELAAQGLTQVAICQQLGYDTSKSKSLSSNPGYKAGRELLKAGKEKASNSTAVESCDSSVKNEQETVKTSTVVDSFNF